jgi:hypothetical protein
MLAVRIRFETHVNWFPPRSIAMIRALVSYGRVMLICAALCGRCSAGDGPSWHRPVGRSRLSAGCPFVAMVKAPVEAKIESCGGDGELLGRLPARSQIVPDALSVVVPQHHR